MSPSTFTPPTGASYFAKLAGFPQYAAEQSAEIKTVNDSLNSQARMNFDGMCAKWQQNVLDHGLAAAGPKPVAPNAIVTQTLETADGVWVWNTSGDPVGVCPDPDTSHVSASGSIVSKAPPSQLDLIQAMLQQILANQANAARK